MVGNEDVENLLEKSNSIHKNVRSNIQIASDNMKERYDINAQTGGYQPGDLVSVYRAQRRQDLSPKLSRACEGSYKFIKQIINAALYFLLFPGCNGKPRISSNKVILIPKFILSNHLFITIKDVKVLSELS